MSIKIDFDTAAIEREIRNAAVDMIQQDSYPVDCPHCEKEVTVPVGKSFCPICKNEIDLKIDINF